MSDRAAWAVIDRAQAGDREAVAELYTLYRRRIFRFIERRVSDRDTAEDLTQDTFVRVCRSIGTVTWTGRDPVAWLLTIARNLVVDHYKSARQRLAAGVPAEWWLPGGPLDLGDDAPPPDEVAAAALIGATVRAALDELSPSHRRVLTLRFLLDLSVEETAARLGLSVGAAKALQYRATQAVAKLITHEAVEAAA